MSGPNDPYDPKQVSYLQPGALESARDQALAALGSAPTLDALAGARTAWLGDRSPLSSARREIGALPPQAKRDAGRRVHSVSAALQQAYEARRTVLEAERDERVLVEETVDVTLPWDRLHRGARSPLVTMQERIVDVFVAMGYEVAEGPEVETEWHNFDALNFPPDHPARELQDAIYLDPPSAGVLLRSHTSPVQVRALLSRPLPVYVLCPGRVFRAEAPDATHSPVFHQVEGLAVDEGITMGHLRGTLDAFASSMFGAGLRTRWRPSYFPFTEPSAEMDLQCFGCRGEGCRICAFEGWIEWGGAGMVHPHVLRACGVDPDRYSGFAFGMGIDRTVMVRGGVPDVRMLFDGDVRLPLALGTEV